MDGSDGPVSHLDWSDSHGFAVIEAGGTTYGDLGALYANRRELLPVALMTYQEGAEVLEALGNYYIPARTVVFLDEGETVSDDAETWSPGTAVRVESRY
jgi:hypothetical protein